MHNAILGNDLKGIPCPLFLRLACVLQWQIQALNQVVGRERRQAFFACPAGFYMYFILRLVLYLKEGGGLVGGGGVWEGLLYL